MLEGGKGVSTTWGKNTAQYLVECEELVVLGGDSIAYEDAVLDAYGEQRLGNRHVRVYMYTTGARRRGEGVCAVLCAVLCAVVVLWLCCGVREVLPEKQGGEFAEARRKKSG